MAWRDYIIHFEQVSELNGWSDKEKAQQLVMSQRGDARKVREDLPQDVYLICFALKSLRGKIFDPPER